MSDCLTDWPIVRMGGTAVQKFTAITFTFETTQPDTSGWTVALPIRSMHEFAFGATSGGAVYKLCCAGYGQHPAVSSGTDDAAPGFPGFYLDTPGGVVYVSVINTGAGVSFSGAQDTDARTWDEFESEASLLFDSGTVTVDTWTERLTVEID